MYTNAQIQIITKKIFNTNDHIAIMLQMFKHSC